MSKKEQEKRRKARVDRKLNTNKKAGRPTKASKKLTRIEELYLFPSRPFVDNLIDTGSSVKSIVDYLRGKGFNTTPQLIARYRNQREAAVKYKGFAEISDFGNNAPDYTKMRALDKKQRAKLQEAYMARHSEEDNLSDNDKELITDKAEFKRTASQQLNTLARHQRKKHRNSKRRVMSDVEFLDVLIQKGMETLAQMPSIDPGKALKAIELKHKLTQGKHGGVTIYGMEEIRLRENARENAMVEAIQRFVPEDQQEALLEQLEYTSKEFYKQHGLEDLYNAEGSRVDDIESYLEAEGLEPDEDDSYYTEDEAEEG